MGVQSEDKCLRPREVRGTQAPTPSRQCGPPPHRDGTWLRDGVAGKLPARRAVAQHPPFSPGNGGRGLQAALEEDISVVLRLLVCSSL